jgi:hypothetical protein
MTTSVALLIIALLLLVSTALALLNRRTTSAIFCGIAVILLLAVGCGPVPALASPIPLAYNFALADLAVHEYTGILRYYVYQQLGWNVTAHAAGSP